MADDLDRRTIIAPWCGAGIEEDPVADGAALLCSYAISDTFVLGVNIYIYYFFSPS